MDLGRQPPAHRNLRTRLVFLHHVRRVPGSPILVWCSHGGYLGTGIEYGVGECTRAR
jgi:hypothetical protein